MDEELGAASVGAEVVMGDGFVAVVVEADGSMTWACGVMMGREERGRAGAGGKKGEGHVGMKKDVGGDRVLVFGE